MTWNTQKSFFSSTEIIKRIEEIPVVKGGQSSGATTRYKNHFSGISILIEDGFSSDICLKEDSINERIIIPD